jgi:hypothetical protein
VGSGLSADGDPSHAQSGTHVATLTYHRAAVWQLQPQPIRQSVSHLHRQTWTAGRFLSGGFRSYHLTLTSSIQTPMESAAKWVRLRRYWSLRMEAVRA